MIFPQFPGLIVSIVYEVIEVQVKETYVATSEITSLEHKLGDHTVELRTRVSEALFSGAKSSEVLSGLGDDIVVKIELDAARLGYKASQ